MDVEDVAAIASVIAAGLAGFSCCLFALASLSKALRSDFMQKSAGLGGVKAKVLVSGFPPFSGLARFLLGFSFVDGYFGKLCQRIEIDGLRCEKEGLCSASVLAILLLVFAGTLFGSLFAGIAFAVCFLAALSGWAARGLESRRDAIREALPEAVRAMGACFHAGFTLQQTFEQLRNELHGPVAELFGRAGDALRTGSSAEEAIELIRGSKSVPELSFIAVALEVQHRAGGSMKQVLDAACESLEGELELRRSLRVHTAQARLSAQVVTGVSFALVGVLSLLTEDFLSPFFESAAGVSMLVCAVAMQFAGIVIVRRILKVEVS